MRKIFSLLFLFTFAILQAEQELEVRLETKVPLKPIYVSRLHLPPNQTDWRGPEELRACLIYDLSHNGFSSIVAERDAAEQKISWPDPKSRIDFVYWKHEQIPIWIALEATADKLTATVVQIEKTAAKRYAEIILTHTDSDRRAVHRLADAIQKDLFGVPGIAQLRILFSQRTQNSEASSPEWVSDIWIADWDGANAERLTLAKGYCMCPGFLPSLKNAYYFVSNHRGQSKLYRGALGNAKSEVWVNLRGNQMLPALSRDGSQLAFISDAAGRPDLFLQNLDKDGKENGKPRQLFSAPNATQASPTFSPDGNQIAFVSDQDGSPRIYVLDIRDAKAKPQLKLISRKNKENTSPAWSPDGKKIAYSSRTDGVRQVWIYDFADGQEWALTSGPENKENPSWAPDSLHLIYNTETHDVSELYMIDLHRQESVQINLGFGQKRFASWEIR